MGEEKWGDWMDKRRLIIGIIVILAIPLYIWIAYFEIPAKSEIGEEKMQQDPLTHNFEKVMQYENDYMGNASNTSQLFQSLPLNEYKQSIEMDPDHLLLIVHYDASAHELQEKTQQAVIYNSTAAFLLIHNLEELEMRFNDETFRVRRDVVEDYFNDEFKTLIDPENFKEKVQKTFNGEKQSAMYKVFTEGK